MEPAVFGGYQETGGQTMAVFADNLSGGKFFLNRTECEKRLANLKNRRAPCGETQGAINNWPERNMAQEKTDE